MSHLENNLLKRAIVDFMRDGDLSGLIIHCNTEDDLKQVKELLGSNNYVVLMNIFTKNLIKLTSKLLELDEGLRDEKVKLLDELVPNTSQIMKESISLYSKSLQNKL